MIKDCIYTILFLLVLFNHGEAQELIVPVSSEHITKEQYSPNGKYVLTSSDFGNLFILWDVRSSRQLKKWEANDAGFTTDPNEIWLLTYDTLRILNMNTDSVIATLLDVGKGEIHFLNHSRNVLISDWENDYVSLWDYSNNKRVKSWSLKQPTNIKIGKKDHFFLVQSKDTLYSFDLRQNKKSNDSYWPTKNLRGYELSNSNDFVIVFYADTTAFEGLSDQKTSIAIAECIYFDLGVVQSYSVPGVSQFDKVEFSSDEKSILLETRWYGSYLFNVESGELIHNFIGLLTNEINSGDFSTKFIEGNRKIGHYKERDGILEVWTCTPFKKEFEVPVGTNNGEKNNLLKTCGFTSKKSNMIQRGNSVKLGHKFGNQSGSLCLFGGGSQNAIINDGLVYPYILWNYLEGNVVNIFEFKHDIISAFFFNKDNYLVMITEKHTAILFDLILKKTIIEFRLFSDDIIFPFSNEIFSKPCNEIFGTDYDVLEKFRLYKNCESSFEIEDTIFHLKTNYQVNNSNKLMVKYAFSKNVKKNLYAESNSLTYNISNVFQKQMVLIFDLITGEIIRVFNNDGIEIQNASFTNHSDYVILETKHDHDDVVISLWKNEGDWPLELLYSKNERLTEYIKTEKLLKKIIEDIEDLEFEEFQRKVIFFEDNHISYDSLFKKNNLNYNAKLEVYSSDLDEFIPTWIIGEINRKRNRITFYLVADGWSRDEKIFIKEVDLITYFEKHYPKKLFNILNDYLSESTISNINEVRNFARRHGINIKHFESESGKNLSLIITIVDRMNFKENVWKIESADIEFVHAVYPYDVNDCVFNLTEYVQDNDKIKIINTVKPDDYLSLYLFDNEPFLLLTSGYYKASKNATKKLHYVTDDLKVIGFEQLDPVYNRPDKVLEHISKYMEDVDQGMIEHYRRAWEKRTDQLGLDRALIGTGELAVPEAEILNADDIPYYNTSGTVNLSVSAKDDAYKLLRFNVFVNEVPVFGAAGISMASRSVHQFDSTLTVPLTLGENKIQVSVMNQLGLESYKYPTYVNYEPAETITPKTLFVGIAVDSFIQGNYNLSYCVKDVNDLATTFQNDKNTEMILLKNSDVTRENVLALKQRLLQTSVHDRVIFSCSSHGELDENMDFYLAMHDMDFRNPQARGLAYSELEGLMDSIPARKKLLLLDACNSGLNDQSKKIVQKMNDIAAIDPGKRGSELVFFEDDATNNEFQTMMKLFVNVQNETGITVVSAAGGAEAALEGILVNNKKLENGVFTYAILEYIKLNNGQPISVNELKKYVENRVEELTNGLQKPTSRQEAMEMDWKIEMTTNAVKDVKLNAVKE